MLPFSWANSKSWKNETHCVVLGIRSKDNFTPPRPLKEGVETSKPSRKNSMRIISPFNDYYDYHQAYDQDKETLFIRKEEQLGLELVKWWEEVTRSAYPNHLGIYRNFRSTGVIFLAGKSYPYCIDKYGEKPRYFPQEDRKSKDNWLYSTEFTLPEEFSKCALIELRPVGSFYGWRRHEVWVNPCLLSRNFHKVLNSWEVYQELTMFFNNLSSPEKEMAKLSDESLAIKHGFDKWSFRKKGGGK